jgi:hypothetical protein
LQLSSGCNSGLELQDQRTPLSSGGDDRGSSLSLGACGGGIGQRVRFKYIYPDEADFLDEKVKEDEASRLWAGVNYPSDITAGDELGTKVAEKVIAGAKGDGSDIQGDITIPNGPGYWTGTNPLRPL